MGDRYDREQQRRRKLFGRMLPPEPILTWGIGDVAAAKVGHNGGPPLDEEPGYLWRKYRWTKAYNEAWKTPSMSVLKFRMARAEAAGLTYHEYMLELLDTGRHLQKEDVDKRKRAVAKPAPVGASPRQDAKQAAPTTPQQPASAASGRKPQPLGGAQVAGSHQAHRPLRKSE